METVKTKIKNTLTVYNFARNMKTTLLNNNGLLLSVSPQDKSTIYMRLTPENCRLSEALEVVDIAIDTLVNARGELLEEEAKRCEQYRRTT